MALVCLLKRNKRIKMEKNSRKKTFLEKEEENSTWRGAQPKISIPCDSQHVLSIQKASSVQIQSFQVQQPIEIDEMAAISNFHDDNGKRWYRAVRRQILPLDDPNATTCWYRLQVGTNSYPLIVLAVRISGNWRRKWGNGICQRWNCHEKVITTFDVGYSRWMIRTLQFVGIGYKWVQIAIV